MKLATLALLLVCLLVASTTGNAQHGPPNYGQGQSFTYCEALDYDSEDRVVAYAYFIENWVQTSECNNTGNIFYGNTIKVRTYFINQHTGAQVMGPQRVFWYDWSADPDAGVKLAVWGSQPSEEPLTITYDPVTLRAVIITSPSFP